MAEKTAKRAPAKKAPAKDKRLRDLIVRENIKGRTFTFVKKGKVAEYRCALCNGRGHNFIEVKDNEGKTLKIGKVCAKTAKVDVPKAPRKK